MSVFGNSASREAAAIRRRARRGVRRRVTAWLGMNPEAARADARAALWELGGRYEKKTARIVRRLRWRGWRIRHDKRLAGRRFNLDHVLISPCGTAIVVADTKRWHAKRETHADGGRLCCGTEDRHDEAEKVARYALLVREALGLPDVAVWPLLAVHESRVRGGHFRVATAAGVVQVVAAEGLVGVLRGAPKAWSWGRSRRVAARVDSVLRPYSGGV
ncbi:nuclease-related domain-containing protein [Streptomyces bluensis]|uniref:Nuclease-related domain-containing protein n=1 Tax=Streptomyces bluensis TaxID=33897 RepID=A0ABW6UU06_9ACTN